MNNAAAFTRRRLARRLASLIVLASSLIAVFVTAAQLYLEFERDVGDIHARFDQIEEAYLPSVVQNVWVADSARLNTLLGGINNLPDFEFAEVRIDGKPFASVGKRPVSAQLIREFPLRYEFRGQQLDIGLLEVGASLDGPVRRTWQRLWFVLLLNALKTALVAALIFLLVRRMITQPLERIAGHARLLAAGDLAQPLSLPVTRLSGSDDEIHGLADYLDDMRQSLMQRQASLEAVNRELEESVQSREVALMQSRTSEAALRDSETRLRTLVQTIPDLIWLKDTQGVYLNCNLQFSRFFGAAETAIIGKTDYDFVAAPQADSFRANDRRAMAADEPTVNEEWLHFADGGYRGLFETIKTPMHDTDGRIVGILGIARDITAREAAVEQIRHAHDEIHCLNENLELRVQQRTAELEAANADLESFSYSVSHDLRSPLRAINGFSAILLEDYAARLDAEGLRLLGMVNRNAIRMSQLIDDILAFSRAGRHEMLIREIDMNALVHETWLGLEAQRGDRAVELRLAELPAARGDIAAIRQVWQNLLGNALKFTTGRTPAVVEVDGEISRNDILYRVRDNGAGFDPDHGEQLFNLFQRLHSSKEFEGTGIGLAIVKRFVTKHGGRVWAEGKPGTGACFGFSLPEKGT